MSPRNGKPQVRATNGGPVGREEVMEAVLDAATDLFASCGPNGVSVRDIANRAGVNHALVHRHFGAKEDLLRSVLMRAVERVARISRQATNTREDLAVVLAALRQEKAGMNLLAWVMLTGYPLDHIWPDYPSMTRFRDILAEEQAEAGFEPSCPVEDPRVAIGAVFALVAGWMVFEPFVGRALGLDEMDEFSADLALNRIAQHILDLAR